MANVSAGTLKSELFRIAPMRRFSLGGSSEVVYFPLSETTRIFPSRVAEVLSACVQLKPLAVHAEVLARLTNAPVSILDDLVNTKAMISYEDLVLPSRKALLPNSNYPGISCVAIPTCGRLRELQRALQSYIACAQRYSRDMRFFVADDSVTADRRQNTKGGVRAVANSSGTRVSYSGFEEKGSFIKKLTDKCDVPRHVIEFALLGPPHCRVRTGTNRNAILLQTRGQLVLSVDDDSVCQTGTLADKNERDKIYLGGEWEIPEWWFFSDRDSALRSVDFVPIDVFTEHEQLLGRLLASLVATNCKDSLRFGDTCPHLLESLLRAEGHIPVTFTGTVGDSGLPSAGWVSMHPSPSTRQRFALSEQTYQRAIHSTEIVRQFLSKVVCHTGTAMCTAVGLDNRNLLPPFFPGYRNQDGVFAVTAKRCMSDAYFGHLPCVLVHDRPGKRENNPDWVVTFGISDLIIECISAWPEPTGKEIVAERLTSLGQYFIDLGSLPPKDFNERVRMLLLGRTAKLINRRGAIISHFGSHPDYWARDLNSQMDKLRRATIDPAFLHPCDLIEEMAPNQVQSATRNMVRNFGELLCWWPTIVEATETLSESGTELGQKVE